MAGRRVLFFGGYDRGPGYPRTETLVQGFEVAGIEVVHLQRDLLPAGPQRLTAAANPLRWPGLAARIASGVRSLERALESLLTEQEFDALLVPYPGLPFVRAAARRFAGPVLLDLFLSLPDTVIGDRRLFRAGGLVERLLTAWETRAIGAADHVLVDTPEQAAYLEQRYGLPRARTSFVPVGDPAPPPSVLPFPRESEELRLLYVGTGVPLHGVEVLLEAVAATDGVRLIMAGGTERQRRAAAALGSKVELIDGWLDAEGLRRELAATHLVAGVFGRGPKAARVVPFKLVHGFAAGRAVITGDTPAVSTLCEPGKDVLTVTPGDSGALARALAGLRGRFELLERVGREARRSYELRFSAAALGARLVAALEAASGVPWSDSPVSGAPLETVTP